MRLTRSDSAHPRHAVEPSWRKLASWVNRRSLLVAAIVLAAGPLAWVLPQSSSASQSPGSASALAAPSPEAIAPASAVAATDDDDLVIDPEGVATTSTPNPAADGVLIGWPVSDHTPSTGFGFRSDPFTHLQRWHDGVDLGQPCGDPAHASLDGTVLYAGTAGGYGNRIILRHANRGGQTFETTYNHLSRIDVGVGDAVKQGDIIGRIGSTGRSTACHMHFEVILGGSYVDPLRFLTGDTSKASLSRRVGSYMPAPVASSASATPSPTTPTPTPTPKATTASPSVTTPSTTPSSSAAETSASTSPSPHDVETTSPASSAPSTTQAPPSSSGSRESESSQASQSSSGSAQASESPSD